MNLHFLKTNPKNPKLQKNLYKFMRHFFIKGIVRGLHLGLKLIYIDETGFKLANNNYFQWRKKDELIFAGAECDIKRQLNMILAFDDEKIVHSYLTNNSINHKNYIEFLTEMIIK